MTPLPFKKNKTSLPPGVRPSSLLRLAITLPTEADPACGWKGRWITAATAWLALSLVGCTVS